VLLRERAKRSVSDESAKPKGEERAVYQGLLHDGTEDAIGGDDHGQADTARQSAPASHCGHIWNLHRDEGLPASVAATLALAKP
jgi:hypothetical protein